MNGQTFQFDNYNVRPIGEQDRAHLDRLIAADEYHCGRMTPDFFLRLVPGEDAWAIEDERGHVVFYFKTQTACRISLQFCGGSSAEDRTRIRTALTKGMEWIEGMLQRNAFREVIFDTDGPALKAMAKRRLGFRESLTELIRAIPPRSLPVPVEVPWRDAPQISRREG